MDPPGGRRACAEEPYLGSSRDLSPDNRAPLQPRHADTNRIRTEQHPHHNPGSLSQETRLNRTGGTAEPPTNPGRFTRPSSVVRTALFVRALSRWFPRMEPSTAAFRICGRV